MVPAAGTVETGVGEDGIGREDDRERGPDAPRAAFPWGPLFAPNLRQQIGLDHIIFWINMKNPDQISVWLSQQGPLRLLLYTC